MGGNKLIIFLFFMFGMVLTSKGQTVPYTYIDPCTGVSTTVQVPTTSGTVTMFYGGQYQTFTYAQLQAGAYDQWVASINSQFPPGTDPCAGLGGDVTDDFNTIMGSTTAGNVANITGIVQMAAGLANSTSGAANTAGGISSSLGGGSTSSGDGGGNSSSNNDGGDEGSTDSGGNSSSTSGNSSTGSSSSSGGNTSTGGDSGSGTSTGGSTGSGTSTGSGNSNGGSTSTGSGSSTGGDTGGSGSSGSSGTSTGGDTGGGNTGGGSTGGGNTGGSSSGGGGNTGSSSGSGEPSVGTGDGSGISADNGGGNTSSDSDMGGMGDQTTTTATGGESESGGDGGSGGGGGGRKKSKQEKVGRGALIGAGDFVVIRNSANPRDTGVDNFKFNASLTHLNTKKTFIKGANFNYQTGENIGNLTLYGSFKTERNMFIFSNATMSNFSSDIFNTTSVMDAVKINKITIMGGTNYTYGYLGKGQFSNWSIIGGGFTNFQGGRYLSSNVMLLGVYSPYIFYYEGQWYKSGLLFIPLINNDIKITDTFKWSISFAGVYQYKGDVLNWQLSTGTKILL